MTKQTRMLTLFGNDLDALLKRTGKSSIREYADECGVNYKYISQLRTMPDRRPGRLYADLLKPFTGLKVIGLTESQQMSLRHRGRPLSLGECKALFPDLPESDLLESIKQTLGMRGETQTGLGRPIEERRKPKVPPPGEQAPFYRRVFVGRETELRLLQGAFDGAMSGQGSLLMVAGEPGIGKTALCEQVEAYAASRGGLTLVGHCYSERSMSLPYLAFVEALRSRVASRERADLRAELGTGAPDLAHIIPEIREKLRVRPRPRGDPEEDKYRLMESVAHFLSSVAAIRPLVLVLEDLHNADKGTLEMLTHVSRSVAGIRMLLVGTYRDVEVDRTHPFSAVLAESRRLPAFTSVLLRGLSAGEVKRMLSTIAGREMPQSLADSIHRQTEGNPLFVQEVIRYLAEEGIVSPQGEIKPPIGVPVEMKIPDGLRDVIGKRLSRLSEPCNRVLAIAAVIGREFAVDILQKVAGVADEELFRALEEGIKAAVIEEKAGPLITVKYRFAHAFFRQILYEGLIAPRRLTLHRQVARTLEMVHAKRLQEHAAELAEHFSYSTYPADLKKAVSYGEMAAKTAAEVYAYGEAERLLTRAVHVQEVLDPDDRAKICDLLLDICDVLLDVPDTRRILDTEAAAAFSVAESLGDAARAARASLLALRAIVMEKSFISLVSAELTKWANRADRYARAGTIERAWADSFLGAVAYGGGDWRPGLPLWQQGYDLARRLSDANALWFAGIYLLLLHGTPQRAQQNLKVAEELLASRPGVKGASMARGHQFGSGSFLAIGFEFVGGTFLAMGQRGRAERVFDEVRLAATRTGNIYPILTSASADAILALIDGRLEEELDMARSIRARGEESGLPELANQCANMADIRARVYLGRRLESLERVFRAFPVAVGDTFHAALPRFCLVLAHLDRKDEVSGHLERFVVSRPGMGTAEDKTTAVTDIFFLEAAVLVGHRRAAELLANRLAGGGLVTTGMQQITCIARHLGGAAVLLSRYDEARQHYQEAIKVCTEMRFRPELALTRLQLAELLLNHYPDEKKDAVEHLDFAIQEFREMKMQPSLERALSRKEIML